MPVVWDGLCCCMVCVCLLVFVCDSFNVFVWCMVCCFECGVGGCGLLVLMVFVCLCVLLVICDVMVYGLFSVL